MEKIKKKIADFIELTRAYSVPMCVAPWFLALMWSQIYFPSYKNIFLSLFGIICVHLGANLLDDYIDVTQELKSGTKLDEIDFGAINNKARLILNGTFSLKSVVRITAILFAIAMLIGIYYTITCDIRVAFIVLLTGILCVLYPFATKFYLGEFIVGLIFGPLLMSGTFLVLSGLLSVRILIFSISVGLLTAVLLHAHALMDWEYDCKRGKNTLCRLSDSKQNAIIVLKVLIALAYTNVVIFVMTGYLNPNCLYVFLTLPIAVELIKSLKDYINIKDVKFIPKWWMGPMEDWKKIQNGGMAFFMYRFYLARNLCFMFCIIAGIACYMS